MKKTILKLTLIFMMLGPASWLGAQDLAGDMLTFYRNFITYEKLECHIRSTVYENRGDAVPYMDRQLKVMIDGINFYYDLGDMVCMINERYVIYVDHNERRMVVSPNNPGELLKAKREFLKNDPAIDLSKNEKVDFMGTVNGIKKYIVENSKTLNKKTTICLNEKDGFLKSIEMEYNETFHTGIALSKTEFTYVNTDPVFASSMFDERRFISTRKGVVTQAYQYKDYNLVYVNVKQETEKIFKQ